MNLTDFLNRFPDAQKVGAGWQARCPAHEDRRASLSIAEGKKGILLHCHAGCPTEAVLAALGMRFSDLCNERPKWNGKLNIVAEYTYTDEAGRMLFQVCRTDKKQFRLRQPDPSKPGRWIWNKKGIHCVPFHLPKMKAAEY